jgi:AraC-like DNA-binding protein
MAQLVRAPRSHRGDRWFDSSCAQFYGNTASYSGRFLMYKFRNTFFIGLFSLLLFSIYCYPEANRTTNFAKSGIETINRDVLIFGISLCTGLCISVAAGFFVFKCKKNRKIYDISKLSENDRQKLQEIYDFIEKNITSSNLSINEMARELCISKSKCESLLKKYYGLPFRDFIMKSRVEIAKERLRCSHSGEKTIADSCGFKNNDEMIKYFMKYLNITPRHYRRNNQVA